MASIRALLAELGSITDRLHVRYCIVAGLVHADLELTVARYRARSRHWPAGVIGFPDLAVMAADPADVTEHYSTTAEGLQPCKQDCMFCLYGDTLTTDA